ncbi:hypothetical protein BH11ACT7_BH11ACT7_00680 [soil metagenome]
MSTPHLLDKVRDLARFLRNAHCTSGRSASTSLAARGRRTCAAVIAFLASEEAGYLTGQILGVNGGRTT